MNSLYGMCCQHCIRDEIMEVYKDSELHSAGEFIIRQFDTDEEAAAWNTMTDAEQDAFLDRKAREKYDAYLGKYSSILNYCIGVWITAYAMLALFELSECLDHDHGMWLYSDTDSIYGLGWIKEKVEEYNESQKKRLKKAGYSCVVKDGKEYWPGVAELDGVYWEFKGLHSKCYAARKAWKDDNGVYQPGELKITVAGVPKKGVVSLNDDLSNFHDGFIFRGEDTGKLTHFYIYRPEPYVDENGIEYGNSVDLHACDYEISAPGLRTALRNMFTEDVILQVYDDE